MHNWWKEYKLRTVYCFRSSASPFKRVWTCLSDLPLVVLGLSLLVVALGLFVGDPPLAFLLRELGAASLYLSFRVCLMSLNWSWSRIDSISVNVGWIWLLITAYLPIYSISKLIYPSAGEVPLASIDNCHPAGFEWLIVRCRGAAPEVGLCWEFAF